MFDNTPSEVEMSAGEDSNQNTDQKKWSEWTMSPKKKKEPQKLTDYTSAIVLMTSAVHVVGMYGV